MDSGIVSGVITAVLLVLFVAGWIWAWSSRRKRDFDAAARLPLEDAAPAPRTKPSNDTPAPRRNGNAS